MFLTWFIAETGYSQYGYQSAAYNSRYSKSSAAGFGSFVRSILPAPPDSRRVVLRDLEIRTESHSPRLIDSQLQLQQQHTVSDQQTNSHPYQQSPQERYMNITHQPQKPKLEISSVNTTLIGDYTSTIFDEFSTKWLVQAVGNATFSSTLESIQQGLTTVDRRYIFIQLGGNQLRTADSDNVYNNLLNLIVIIRDRNPESRIFIVAVIPRPIDNDQVKVLIMKMNRWLRGAVERVARMFQGVKFLPVQLAFLNGAVPNQQLYNENDQLTLNDAGARVFKQQVFKLARFARNV